MPITTTLKWDQTGEKEIEYGVSKGVLYKKSGTARDAKWTGVKPYRTYSGQRYIGGFSDHLPVYVDFSW